MSFLFKARLNFLYLWNFCQKYVSVEKNGDLEVSEDMRETETYSGMRVLLNIVGMV